MRQVIFGVYNQEKDGGTGRLSYIAFQSKDEDVSIAFVWAAHSPGPLPSTKAAGDRRTGRRW